MDDTALHPPAPSRALMTVIVLCFGGMTVSLTQTLVVPIQGQLPTLLNTSPSNAGWVVTITLLAGAVSMVMSGRLGDLLGKQRVLIATASLLVVGSLISALSDTLIPMLAGRALQGFAMGFIPVGIALIREVTPPAMANTAIAAMSATLGVGGAIGLPLSAFVAQTFDWHAIFWMGAVLSALMALGVVVLVPHRNDHAGGSLDFVGAIGLTIGLVSTLIGVSKGTNWGWTSGRTLGSIVGGIVVLIVWGAYELRRREPLVNLRVSSSRPVLLTNLAAVAIGFGMMAQSIVIPQLLQLPSATGFGLDQTLLAAGLWMAPAGLMMMAFAPVSGRLMTVIGPKQTLIIGAVVIGVGYLSAFFLMSSPWQLLVASSIAAAGVGIGYGAMPTLIMGNVSPREAGAAVGINALMRSIGTTSAAAVMVTVLTSSTRDFNGITIPTEGAYQLCFLIGAIAAFAGVALTAMVPHVHARAARAEVSELADAPV
ncbi:MFS transporter [soil metagenome]